MLPLRSYPKIAMSKLAQMPKQMQNTALFWRLCSKCRFHFGRFYFPAHQGTAACLAVRFFCQSNYISVSFVNCRLCDLCALILASSCRCIKHLLTPSPTTKQHAIVNIQLNIVACPTYPEKFIRDNVAARLYYFWL